MSLCPRRRHPWVLAVLRLRTLYRCVIAHFLAQKSGRLKKLVRERFAGMHAFWKLLTPHPATTPFNGGISVLRVAMRARVLPKSGGHQHPKSGLSPPSCAVVRCVRVQLATPKRADGGQVFFMAFFVACTCEPSLACTTAALLCTNLTSSVRTRVLRRGRKACGFVVHAWISAGLKLQACWLRCCGSDVQLAFHVRVLRVAPAALSPSMQVL